MAIEHLDERTDLRDGRNGKRECGEAPKRRWTTLGEAVGFTEELSLGFPRPASSSSSRPV
jgi:hypothetical protein